MWCKFCCLVAHCFFFLSMLLSFHLFIPLEILIRVAWNSHIVSASMSTKILGFSIQAHMYKLSSFLQSFYLWLSKFIHWRVIHYSFILVAVWRKGVLTSITDKKKRKLCGSKHKLTTYSFYFELKHTNGHLFINLLK